MIKILHPLLGIFFCLTLTSCGWVEGASSKKDRSMPSNPDPATGPSTQPRPQPEPGPVGDSSYLPVVDEVFAELRARLSANKDEFMTAQKDLLTLRYDLSDHAVSGVTMTRGKPVQGAVRVKLPQGQTWASLTGTAAHEIRLRGIYPPGFLPLTHPRHAEGGQILPQFHIDAIKAAEGRDLQRFDVEMDLPDHFLPEFPAPIFLTTRPDLGDVSQGQLVTIKNYFTLFNGILTPRQLDGVRLLVTSFPQQQYNLTDDRRVDTPQQGISCLDCHANGHTNAATHLDPVTRPQEMRRRLDTPTLRGVNIQRLFGSQRAIKTIEDFTEFEQLGAYFDGDHVIAAKKGYNKLDRALQVAHMAEFQSLLNFPPAQKLGVDGRLIADLAAPEELRGEELFFGKANCASCHTAPYYTDNNMYDLATERFYAPQVIAGQRADGDGLIKTFPLRGIKESPPYLHDGRLLTLADTVEFFNLVLELRLSEQEKADLVSFLMVL